MTPRKKCAIISSVRSNATTSTILFLISHCMKISQMQALKSQKGGFTLVELIVVITILAILATVGFLALSGYTKEAKNSTVMSNIVNLEKAITTSAAAGASMSAMLSGTTQSVILTGTQTILGFSGSDVTTQAGDIKWSELSGIDSTAQYSVEDTGDAAKPLFGFATSSKNPVTQIATTVSKGEAKEVYIRGNYSPAEGSDDVAGLIMKGSGYLVHEASGTHR